MVGKPRILSFSTTRLIKSIKHEHFCKILYKLFCCYVGVYVLCLFLAVPFVIVALPGHAHLLLPTRVVSCLFEQF